MSAWQEVVDGWVRRDTIVVVEVSGALEDKYWNKPHRAIYWIKVTCANGLNYILKERYESYDTVKTIASNFVMSLEYDG